MFDWIRGLFGRSRTLRDDQITTTQSTVYAPGSVDEDTSQGGSSGSDYGGGSEGSGFGGGGDSGGGGGNGGGS
jgi:hypothetical protein